MVRITYTEPLKGKCRDCTQQDTATWLLHQMDNDADVTRKFKFWPSYVYGHLDHIYSSFPYMHNPSLNFIQTNHYNSRKRTQFNSCGTISSPDTCNSTRFKFCSRPKLNFKTFLYIAKTTTIIILAMK